MTSSLLRWLDEPSSDRGIHLSGDAGEWNFRSYAQIASAARGVAEELAGRGVTPGSVVCIVLPTDHDSLATFFGIWAAGAVICPIAPPAMQQAADYISHVAAIIEHARPVATISPEPLADLISAAMARARRPGAPWVISSRPGNARLRRPGELALLQFTSGSTARPCGIQVPWRSLDANIAAIQHWLRWQEGEGTASWLPFYHDMGLVGCLLTTVAAQGDLWLMRPDQFIRDPRRWLMTLTPDRGCRTSAPPFGYAYAAARIATGSLDGLDLSGVRAAVVGAECIDMPSLERFASLLGSRGFAREAFAPAYGLAEATLLVAGGGIGKAPTVLRPDWGSVAFGAMVEITACRTLESAAGPGETGWLVGCGGASRGTSITIAGNDGEPLPDGHLGEITVAGASIASGYAADPGGRATRFDRGVLRTGDAGFIVNGELFVIGRMGDSLKIRGRTVFVETLESRLASYTGLRRGRYAVVNTTANGRSGVALLAEVPAGDWVPKAGDLLGRELSADCSVTIITGKSGLIKRTSSGKPRRRHMWELIRSGTTAGTIVYRNDGAERDSATTIPSGVLSGPR
jgi:acyl-CoA synthetase (AMP-forming)/AMP-acid ligase II